MYWSDEKAARAVGAHKIVCVNTLDGPSTTHAAEVVVRAAVVAAGRPEFEAVRARAERWPVASRAVVRPIARPDLDAILQTAADWAPGEYVVGGPEAITYAEYVRRYATVRGLRRWVLARGKRTGETPPFATGSTPVDDAIRAALEDQRAELPVFDLRTENGVQAMRTVVPVTPGTKLDLAGLGGSLRWYGLAWTWWLRIILGKLFGERLTMHQPAVVERGATVDWWTVVNVDDHHLVLYTDRWFTGEAWLGYRIVDARLEQVGVLRTKGLLGWLYWWAVYPIHRVVFRVMARKKARRSA